MASIILPQFFLPQTSVKLGRFITSIESPYDGFHDPECPTTPSPIVTVREDHKGEAKMDTSNTSSFSTGLTKLLSANLSRGVKSTVSITADKVTTTALPNSDAWFNESTTLPSTRTWIERQVEQGRKIYLVVGLHTVTNARIIQEAGPESSVDGSVQVPATLSLAAVGVVVPLGDIVDPSVGGDHRVEKGGKAEFLVPGEQVCALQCRRVGHRWLSSRSVDKARLLKPWWPSVEMWRDEEEGEDDIIEVDVKGIDDIEADLLDEGWNREVVGDEVIYSA
jgi:hypothetical protein